MPPRFVAVMVVTSDTEDAMTHAAVHESPSKEAAAMEMAPGAIWFGSMVAIWSIFFTLLIVSPQTLDDAYDWLTGLAIVWEILMWIVLLPWAVTYVVWESAWVDWLRVLVIVLVTVVHLSASAPRVKR
jgi:hypothetical protein